jgi:hypothetical protein
MAGETSFVVFLMILSAWKALLTRCCSISIGTGRVDISPGRAYSLLACIYVLKVLSWKIFLSTSLNEFSADAQVALP